MTNYPIGWDCTVISARLERYLSGDLPRAELLVVAAHLEACELCFERLMAYRVAVVVASPLPAIQATPKSNNKRRRRGAPTKKKGRTRRG